MKKVKIKKVVAMVMMVIFVVVAITACGSTETEVPEHEENETEPPTNGDVNKIDRPKIVRFSADNTPKLDPQVATDYVGTSTVCNLYDALVYQEGGDQLPNLATNWEVSDDGLEYTFYLKKGAKFHDGSEVKASDVVFTLKRWQTIGEGFSYLFNNVYDCVALDDYTVKFILAEPQGAFIDSVCHLYILNEDLVMANIIDNGTYGKYGDYGKEFLLNNDAGSGPYMATEISHQDYFLASRFKDWHNGWEGRENAPEQFKAIYLTEASTQYTMMANQQLEITNPWFTPENYKALDELPGVDLFKYSRGVTQYIWFNTQKAPTDCIYYRKALSCLLDYDSFITSIFPGSGKPVGPISRLVSGHTDDVVTYEYNIEKAKEYLSKSKYADNYMDIPLECTHLDAAPPLEKVFLSLQANLEQLGIKMEIQTTTWLSYQDRIRSKETTPNISSVNIGPAVNDAATYLSALYSTETQGTFENVSWFGNPELDKRINDAIRISDKEERNLAAAELQKYLSDEVVGSAPIADLTEMVAYQSEYLDWAPAKRLNETGNIESIPNGYVFFMPNISFIPGK